MTNQELLDLFAEGLEVAPDTLSAETRIADVEEWNSLGWLTIMSLVDEKLGIQLGAKDIRGFKTAQDVMDYIAAKAPITA